MTRILIIISIIILTILIYTLMRNIGDIKTRMIILLSPLLLGILGYLSVFLLTKDIPPDVCDGGALMGLLFSFVLIGIGIILNIANIIYILIRKIKLKGKNLKCRRQIILGLILLLISIMYFLKDTKINRRIAKDLDIKVPYTLEFYYTDSHGGFHGDGIALGRAELKDKDIDKLLKDSKNHWTKVPIPKELDTILYGDESYHSDLATRLAIKPIENGYWIYIDRFRNKREYLKEREIDIYSNNYSIGLLDLEEKRFYYIKFDS